MPGSPVYPPVAEGWVIKLDQVSKSFGDFTVLDEVTLEVAKGRTTTILGPSGTGKSVLLKHIVGLLEPDAGHVWVGDVDMGHARERERYAVRRRFGMLFQDGALFDGLSTGDNIAFPLVHHTKMSESERRARVDEVLELVELPGLYDRPTSALSGGQRKRVGLARAIVMEPDVVLFDEPNSGLDPLTSQTIDALIKRMQKQLGITFLVITHDIVQALAISDYIGMLYEAHLIEFGSAEEFLHSRQRVVRDFLARNATLPEVDGPLLDPP